MLILQSNTEISGYNLDFVTDVEITSSWDNLTDTAKFTIPKKLVFKRKGEVVDDIVRGSTPIFDIGDPVTLNAGYLGGINTSGITERFKGFISNINPSLPIEMEFEDDMYSFKQLKVGKYSVKGKTISEVLTAILPEGRNVEGRDFIGSDRKIGYIRVNDPRTTIAQLLKHLKDKHGVISYFRDGVLISGFAYITENPGGAPTNHIFNARKNIINSDSLEYSKKENYKVNLKVISTFLDNTKIEATAGDPDGDRRTIYVFEVPEADLQERADQELLKFKYEGFRGSFETFLEPQVKHGDSVTLIDDRITDKNGTYLVKSVVTRYGISGGRQMVELDRLISE